MLTFLSIGGTGAYKIQLRPANIFKYTKMLESTVLHHGRGGGDGDVVGISWKMTTKSQSSSPSLVVTCAHQVVVYKVIIFEIILWRQKLEVSVLTQWYQSGQQNKWLGRQQSNIPADLSPLKTPA